MGSSHGGHAGGGAIAIASSAAPVGFIQRPALVVLVVACLLSAGVTLQVVRDSRFPAYEPANRVMYVQAPGVVTRLALSFNAMAADLYWIRAVQYYGGTKLSARRDKSYEQLYPLLDITTSLDPYFKIAYRFGAILLSETYPSGPGRPDLALALLRKGATANPGAWEYVHDQAFVHYWSYQDYQRAAEYFLAASRLPGAPNWLAPVAASTLAEGGDLGRARFLWTQIRDTADAEWIRRTATLRLVQLDAMEQIQRLDPVVAAHTLRVGRPPTSWQDVVRAGLLPGIPVDPVGIPYRLLPDASIDVDAGSPLWPVRRPAPPGARR